VDDLLDRGVRAALKLPLSLVQAALVVSGVIALAACGGSGNASKTGTTGRLTPPSTAPG
jgi:hypothetical protein